MAKVAEIRKLRIWLDAELTVNHAYYWAILGAIIGGKFWIVAGIGISISVLYAARRAAKLPRNYLDIKDIPNRLGDKANERD